MPIDFEDRTDISGTPPAAPSRPASPQQVNRTQTGAQVPEGGQQKPKPKPQEKNLLQQAGDLAKGVESPFDGFGQETQKALQSQPLHPDWKKALQAGNPFAPFDLVKAVSEQGIDNDWVAYGVLRDISRTWTRIFDKSLPESIHNVWTQNSALAKIAKMGIKAGYLENPVNPAYYYSRLSGKEPWGENLKPGAKDEQAATEYEKGAGPLALNPLNYIMPEGLAGKAAVMAAQPLAEAALSAQKPEDMEVAVVWAAMAGAVLGGGHLPHGVSKALSDQFPKAWPAIEGFLRGAVGSSQKAKADAVSPILKDLPDQVKKELDAANEMVSQHNEFKNLMKVVQESGYKPIKKDVAYQDTKEFGVPQTTPKGKPSVTTTRVPVKPEERIKQLTDSEQGARKRILKKFGAADEGELSNYVLTHPLTEQQFNVIKKSWGKLLFGDPLLQEGLPMGQFIDPQGPLEQIADPAIKQSAVQATQDFSYLRHLANAGPFKNPGNAIESMWRGLVGHNDSLEHFYPQFAESLINVDKSADWKHLHNVAELLGADREEGKAAYEALPPSQQYQVSMYRLLSSLTGRRMQQAGVMKGLTPGFVPRIDEPIPFAKAQDWMGKLRQNLTREGYGGRNRVVTQSQRERSQKMIALPRGPWEGSDEAHLSAHQDFGKLGKNPEDLIKGLRGELGDAVKGFSDQEMAALHFVLAPLEDSRKAVVQSLAKMKPATLRRTIQQWMDSTGINYSAEAALGIHHESPSLTLRIVPAFESVKESNAAITKQRNAVIEALTTGKADQAQKIAREKGVALPVQDQEVQDLLKSGDAEAIKNFAARLYRPKIEGLDRVLRSNYFSNQLKASHTADLVGEWRRTLTTVTDKATGQPVQKMAAYRIGNNARENKHFLQLGYQQFEGAHGPLKGIAFEPGLHKLLQRATYMNQSGLKSHALEELARLESSAVHRVLYSPMMHGLNMAGRLAGFGLSHMNAIGQMLHYIKAGKLYSPTTRAMVYEAMDMEATRHGVTTPHSASRMIQGIGARMSDYLGEAETHDLAAERELQDQTLRGKFKKTPVGKVYDFLTSGNQMLWSYVHNFQVLAYHIELESAVRSGMPEANAKMWAALRANTWGDMVSDIDHSPDFYRAARLAFMAPNWWRTWAQLMVPMYSRSGVQWTPKMVGYAARQGAAAAMAFFAVQKVSGNTMNFLLSGHFQNENEPGHQDDIEIGRKELLHPLKAIHFPGTANIDPDTGKDPKTGGRMYMENPLGRQAKTTEQAAGFQSGQEHWDPTTLPGNAAKVLAARSSPLMQSLSTLAGYDLYGSVASGQLRSIDPGHELPPGSNVAMAILSLSPLGFNVQNAARAVGKEQQKMDTMQDAPFGTRVLQVASDMAAASPGVAQKVGLSLTGVNPPYESAHKTRGQQPSDQDYQKLKAINDTYYQNLTNLSLQMYSGQLLPSQWASDYRQLSQAHRGAMQALLGNSPDYTDGTLGLVAQYENTYQQATNPQTGMVDPDHLKQLQDQFKSQHSQAELDSMSAELSKHDQKIPALASYHRALNSYYKWQGEWATEHGMTPRQLQAMASQYNSLFASDPRAATHYEQQNPAIKQYFRDRKRIFERTPDGIMYGLFFNSTAVGKYLNQHHITIQEALAAQQAS